jgi:hypothetical protein
MTTVVVEVVVDVVEVDIALAIHLLQQKKVSNYLGVMIMTIVVVEVVVGVVEVGIAVKSLLKQSLVLLY